MFGSGIRYWICKVPLDQFIQFEKLQIKYNTPYETIFFDLELMNKFGYSSVEEFHTIHSGRGFLIKERNTIEIKHKKKRLNKFDSNYMVCFIYRI